MAVMDHDGYWYNYLAARHDIVFYLGLISFAIALISAISGYILVSYQGMKSRADDPKNFWQAVAIYLLMGTAFWGLYAFGPR